ncbi:hypothetical protein AWB68_04378 [Caballeronia choica]|uniref:Uncharacterized protein n=1 Tax=Caballeronia choica TaxID=326476 RepID=A0A158JXQ1_9BURK|nr:hypothetical protein AWB68_04378 [Caballeronia choica]
MRLRSVLQIDIRCGDQSQARRTGIGLAVVRGDQSHIGTIGLGDASLIKYFDTLRGDGFYSGGAMGARMQEIAQGP